MGDSADINFDVREAAGQKMKEIRTSEVTKVDVGSWRSGRCKGEVYLTVVVEILATMVTVMWNSASSRVVFFRVRALAMALRADLST